jgi:GDP-4-dehydro-6-deoxy-D-mannose reductase
MAYNDAPSNPLKKALSVRVLITGAGGFVGAHLRAHLQEALPHAQLYGTTLTPLPATPNLRWLTVDLRDADATARCFADVQPEQVYHLAGQASVDVSFKDTWATFEANVLATHNVLSACRLLPTPPRVLVVTSAEIYGAVRPQDLPVTEETPLRPTNPYSVSKASQDLLAQQVFFTYGLPVLRARPFNHLGVGQSEMFVATAFAMQIARIEAGLQEPVLRVGNLNAERDFTNVRDIVRAYALLMQDGVAGEAYNIASGQTRSIRALLETLLGMSSAQIAIEQDPTRLRPSDTPVIAASCQRLHQATGWRPAHTFEATLREVLDDCRQRVRTQT